MDVLSADGWWEGSDGPVGPLIAADGRDARLGVVELDASLDPFAGLSGWVGESEEEAGLVVLGGVGSGEGEGSGLEGGEGAFAVRAEGGCDWMLVYEL